ncbi:hypothetical protein [Mucilaginibacter sp. SJ]|uniref:hypothetical protein n=1 Tax=Mucilaginibacter sp. SJ TaxID=3029053 RepID=UPI0023A99FBF|nr:hypothetical protein [Mucilaginibacter sp. SJ]WEA00094.1 hypothetical protein MusilaSJ_21800 [Mucilaginibacter sp. SJ]
MRKFFTLLLLCAAFMDAGAQQKNVLSRWNPGSYYDLQNNKITGFIRWNVPNRSLFKGVGDDFLYRVTVDGDKQKIKTAQFRAFVIGIDSFVVSHNKDLELFPILLVLIDRPTKLYVRLRYNQTAVGGFGSGATMFYSNLDRTYYYGPDPDNVTELDRQHFIAVMSDIVSDKPRLVEKIKNKDYRKGDMEDILDEYYFERNAQIAKEEAEKKSEEKNKKKGEAKNVDE